MTSTLHALLDAARRLTRQEKIELIYRLSAALLGPDEASGDGSPDTEFWHPKSLEVLAAEQAIEPAGRVGDLTASWWPEDETADEFVAFLRRQREHDRLSD